jgi:hypothetical protein
MLVRRGESCEEGASSLGEVPNSWRRLIHHGEAHSRGVEGARVKEGAYICGVFARGGAHLSLVRTKPWREARLCRGCKTKGKSKGARQGSSSSKDKGKHKERGPRY